jgi:hypothetical protein
MVGGVNATEIRASAWYISRLRRSEGVCLLAEKPIGLTERTNSKDATFFDSSKREYMSQAAFNKSEIFINSALFEE